MTTDAKQFLKRLQRFINSHLLATEALARDVEEVVEPARRAGARGAQGDGAVVESRELLDQAERDEPAQRLAPGAV